MASGKIIGIVLPEKEVLAVATVLETKAALAGIAVCVRGIMVIRTLLTTKTEEVAAASVEVVVVMIVIAMKQAFSKVEAAVRMETATKVE